MREAQAVPSRNPVRFAHVLRPSAERYPVSHAPYLSSGETGSILLTWFAGSREWARDVNLLAARCAADGPTRSEIHQPVGEVAHSVGNSVVQADARGRLHLWYVRTRRYWQEGEIVHLYPFENGAEGATRTTLPLEPGWLVRGRPVLKGDRIYLPVYHESEMVGAVWEQALASDTGELHEQIGAPGGLIQPTLVAFGDQELRGFFRNCFAPNRVHHAYSMDRGRSWSRPLPTALPCPNSGLDVARLDEEVLVCAYNHSPVRRHPLSLAVSRNRGIDWVRVFDLELQQGEFSYPSLLRRPDGLFLAYTFNREGIKFVALDAEALLELAEAAC